jgi:hypothetical protein
MPTLLLRAESRKEDESRHELHFYLEIGVGTIKAVSSNYTALGSQLSVEQRSLPSVLSGRFGIKF